MATSIVSNSTATTFGNSPQKTGEPVDRLNIYSGKALEFDGVSDRLVFSSTNPGEAYTVAAWIYNDATGLRNITDGSGTGQYIVLDASNKPAIYTGTPGWKGGDVITNLEWHRIIWIMSNNGADFDCYVDGKQAGGNFPSTGGTYTSSTFTGIGALNAETTSPSRLFGGKMSDFQLWDKAWTEADVQYDYNNPETLASVRSGTSLVSSNLLKWYPMNDTGLTNPQTVVFDAAGTNNTTKNHATTTFLGDELLDETSNFTDANWDDGAQIAFSSNNIDFTAADDGDGTFTTQHLTEANPFTVVAGAKYQITVTVASRTSGRFVAKIGNANDASPSSSDGTFISTIWVGSAGTFVFEIAASDASEFILQMHSSEGFVGSISAISVKEMGIATGWTDADQQQYIPQTAFMDGCIKTIFNEPDDNNERIDLAWGNGVNTQNYSYSSWIFPISGNGMFMTPSSFGTNQRLYMALTSSKWDLGIGSKSWETAPDSGSLPSATLNAWAHYTLVVNDTQGIVYINGTEAFRRTPATTSFTLPANMDLMASGNNYVFGGIIDEVSIFNTALSDTQVLALYNNGQPLHATRSTAASNLVGYWRNNVLTSTGTWEDLSTNDNHGTVTGSPSGSIFFQQGVTANLCTQGYSDNIVQPSKGAVWFSGSATTTGTSSYADIGRDIEIEGDFMVMFWFKVPNTSTNYLFGYGNDDFFRISDEDTFQLKINGTSENINLNGGTDIAVEQWHHIALTRTGATGVLKIYFDNVEQTATSATDTSTLKIRALMRKGTSSSNYGYGMIDDFFVYDNFNENAINKNYKHGKSQHKNS